MGVDLNIRPWGLLGPPLSCPAVVWAWLVCHKGRGNTIAGVSYQRGETLRYTGEINYRHLLLQLFVFFTRLLHHNHVVTLEVAERRAARRVKATAAIFRSATTTNFPPHFCSCLSFPVIGAPITWHRGRRGFLQGLAGLAVPLGTVDENPWAESVDVERRPLALVCADTHFACSLGSLHRTP